MPERTLERPPVKVTKAHSESLAPPSKNPSRTIESPNRPIREQVILPAQDASNDSERIPCQDCGRQFNSQALQKHIRICNKVFGQKRKEFDMKAFREPTDAAGKGLESHNNIYKPSLKSKRAAN